MQKKLPDYINAIIDRRSMLREFYEPDAFIFCDEAVIVAGQLIGLNIIDCNGWSVKDEDLDVQANLINLKNYLKDGNRLSSSSSQR